MNDSLLDAAEILLATLLYIPLLVLPGLGAAAVTGVFGFRRRPAQSQFGVGLIAAFALLPACDSLIVRFLDLPVALGANLLLAGLGVAALVRTRPVRQPSPVRPLTILALAAWFALVCCSYVDLTWRGRLYQSYLGVDLVKHAATIRSLVHSGAPPADPFFARPVASGYYYFFYTLGALGELAGRGWVDARAAFAGLVFWTGLGVFALVQRLLSACGCGGPALRTAGLVALGLMLIAGLDIVPISLLAAQGNWPPTLGYWNEEVTPWLLSLLWVPHHVTATIAAWAGFLALAEAISPSDPDVGDPMSSASAVPRPPRAVLVGFAALAFASALGCSTWVSLAAVLTVLLWLLLLWLDRRPGALMLIAAAGLLSVVVAGPQLRDMVANRSDHRLPVAMTIRAFTPLDSLGLDPRLDLAGRVLLLPLNYGLEFGVFLVGAAAYVWRARPGELLRPEIPRLLTLSAVAGLILGTFSKSTVIYNDLGWRVMLFPQLSMLIWTTMVVRSVLLQGQAGLGRQPPALVLSLCVSILLGCASSIYGLLALRLFSPLARSPCAACLDRSARVRFQLRDAFGWLALHTPVQTVVQQNPTLRRVLDFGLYGRNRVGVADRDARLFGASEDQVAARLADLGPIFTTDLAASEVARRARAGGVEDLIVTADDPVWKRASGWVWTSPPLYRSELVRVIPAAGLR